MDAAHHLVLLAGVPELPSIFAGLFSARFGTPILLVFLAIGMLFGKEGPVSLVFNCTQTAYLIGSAALAVILFEGGLKTKRSMLKIACGLRWRWPGLESRSPPASSAPCSPCSPLHLRPPRLGSQLIGAILSANRRGSGGHAPAPRPAFLSQVGRHGT